MPDIRGSERRTITGGTRAVSGRGPVTYCEAPRGCRAESGRGIPTPRRRPWPAAGTTARPAPCRARRGSWKPSTGRSEAFKINTLAAGRTLLTNGFLCVFAWRVVGTVCCEHRSATRSQASVCVKQCGDRHAFDRGEQDFWESGNALSVRVLVTTPSTDLRPLATRTSAARRRTL